MKSYSSLFAIIVGFAISAGAAAQDFPNKPLKMIVPYAPGGATDIFGRIVADGLSKELGQPVIVENRTGGGGNVGAIALAKSAPDGYTLGIATVGTHATNPACNSKGGYDPVRDFAPVSNLARTPNVVTLNAEFPARDFKEFMDYVKKNPGKVSFGTSGTCGVHHMTAEHFKALTGADIVHVPYRGTGPALVDVVAGRVQMLFDSMPGSLQNIQTGKLRPMAVASAKRLPSLPDVPTYAEIGLEALNDPVWYGLVAPAGTPAAIIDKINAATRKVLAAPDVVARIVTAGGEPAYTSPAEYGAEIKAAAEKMRHIAQTRGITQE